MKRTVSILITLYIVLGFISLLSMGRFTYYDTVGRDNFVVHYFFLFLLIAILMGIGGFFLYKKMLPEKYEQRIPPRPWLKIIIPLLLTILCFIVNLGLVFGYDSVSPDSGTYTLKGFVTNKIMTHGKSRGYFVWVRDDASSTLYKFEVTLSVYNKTAATSEFNKQFNIDKLGILYRKEE